MVHGAVQTCERGRLDKSSNRQLAQYLPDGGISAREGRLSFLIDRQFRRIGKTGLPDACFWLKPGNMG